MLKNLLVVMSFLFVSQAFAAGSKAPIPGDYNRGSGRSDFACVTQNTSNFSMYSYIARSSSQLEAQTLSSNKCVEEATFASNCASAQCERDPINGGSVSVDVISRREGNMIKVSLRGASNGAEAVVKNTSSSQVSYFAEAPTLIEARALAMNACVEEATFPSNCEVQYSRRY